MKKDTLTKLSLNHQTIRVLKSAGLHAVAGGRKLAPTIGCNSIYNACPSIDFQCNSDWLCYTEGC